MHICRTVTANSEQDTWACVSGGVPDMLCPLCPPHPARDVAKSDKRWRIILLRYFNPVGAHLSGDLGEHPVGVPNNLMPYVHQVGRVWASAGMVDGRACPLAEQNRRGRSAVEGRVPPTTKGAACNQPVGAPSSS